MGEEGVARKLAAILYADVADYSRLTGQDELGTHKQLGAALDLISDEIKSKDGRVVHYAGDAVLADFGSVVAAVDCAVSIQLRLAESNAQVSDDKSLQFRIGVNLGEVIVDRDDIYGDGVNIAARLEGLAKPGGICISGRVFEQVENKLEVGYDYLGEREVKNIKKPVRVYQVLLDPKTAGTVIGGGMMRPPKAWKWGALAAGVVAVAVGGAVIVWLRPWAPPPEVASEAPMAVPLPDKPSIAVLPFANLSDDPAQEYFADGMTEDLITDLSKLSGLFVIARNSVFAYKGKAVNVQKVGRELGVRYVLEGSVRRVGDKIRINAQLIDASNGSHLWAERYDGRLDDIFTLQDKVARKIIGELAVRLDPKDQAIQTQKETESATAHDAFLRGWAHFLRETPEHYRLAIPFFEEAVQRDGNYGRAYAALAAIYNNAWTKGWQSRFGLTPDDTQEKAMAYLEKTKEHPSPLGHQVASAFSSYAGQHDDAIAEAGLAIALNANNPAGYFAAAKALTYAGRPAKGVEMIKKAMRLNPHHPPDYLFHLGMGLFNLERFSEAVESLEEARKRVPEHRGVLTFLNATYGFLERTAEAESALDQLKGLAINAFMNWHLYTIVLEADVWPFKEPADLDRLRRGLRLGGMPEFQDEWGLSRANKLSGDEIRALAFGRSHHGRHPVSGLEFTFTRTADGRFTAKGLWSDTGVSRIVGDRLCNEWTKYRPSCAVIYRNPDGTRELRNEYLLVQRSGAFPFSVTD